MNTSVGFSELIARAKAGEEAAIHEFLSRFEKEVRMMVRGRLPKKLRTRFDSLDFVQAVWQSFFSDLKDGTNKFENAKHLRGFLAGVARNKVFEEHRRLTRTGKYAIDREQSLYLLRGGQLVERPVVSHEPSPSQNMQASDRLAQLMSGCTIHEVEVITLRHRGLTFEEIAKKTGLHERTVRRVIDAARSRMEARR